jgi:hypothetical protein
MEPPTAIGGGASCKFTTHVPGVSYHAHFQGDGRFCVSLTLAGGDARKRFEVFQRNKQDLMKRLGFAGRFSRHVHADKQLELRHEGSGSVYRIAVYYHEPVSIVDDGRDLKRVRNQARKWLLALKQAVDNAVVNVPETAAQADKSQPHAVAQ